MPKLAITRTASSNRIIPELRVGAHPASSFHHQTLHSVRPRLDQLPDWLSIDEARAVLGVGRSSMYELVRSGAIPSRKFGRLIRIPREALRWQTDSASSKEVAP